MAGRAAEDLSSLLREEAHQFRRLLGLLGDEQNALRIADGAGVLTSLRAQQDTLSRIRALEGRRESLVAALAVPLGLDPRGLTMSRLLQAWPEAAGTLAAVRAELRALLMEIRRVNERNAVLVSRGLGYVDRLIAHLTSALAPERAPAYGALGRPASASTLGLVDRRA